MTTRKHHWTVGAGQVGCLYDYGPEAYPTKRDAMNGAEWYLDGCDEASKADVRRMRSDLHNYGIHYLPVKLRQAGYGDYIELTRQDGPMPEDNQ